MFFIMDNMPIKLLAYHVKMQNSKHSFQKERALKNN